MFRTYCAPTGKFLFDSFLKVLLDLEIELGSLYEQNNVDFNSGIVVFLLLFVLKKGSVLHTIHA